MKRQAGVGQDTEIKGAECINGPLSPLMRKMSEAILSERLPIGNYVVERRYMVMALILENLFDPLYNPLLGNEWTHPTEIKKNIANHLYANLSPATVALAGRAFTESEDAQLNSLLAAIQAEIDDAPVVDGVDIPTTLEGVRPAIPDLAASLRAVMRRAGPPIRLSRGGIKSPNTPSFFYFVMHFEHLFDGIPNSGVRVVFDSSTQFDATFEDLVQVCINATPHILLFRGHPPLAFGLKAITGFEVENSATEPLLQIADFYAVGARKAFELALATDKPESLSPALTYHLGFLAEKLRGGHFNYVISDHLARLFWDTMHHYAAE